mmetsp:Transcript_1549/g.4933  ORF Transcript_1549/g.4933 Transcript_1549/m.4933 type:complete len:248 (+) Transcript_1549:2996-3739(+)
MLICAPPTLATSSLRIRTPSLTVMVLVLSCRTTRRQDVRPLTMPLLSRVRQEQVAASPTRARATSRAFPRCASPTRRSPARATCSQVPLQQVTSPSILACQSLQRPVHRQSRPRRVRRPGRRPRQLALHRWLRRQHQPSHRRSHPRQARQHRRRSHPRQVRRHHRRSPRRPRHRLLRPRRPPLRQPQCLLGLEIRCRRLDRRRPIRPQGRQRAPLPLRLAVRRLSPLQRRLPRRPPPRLSARRPTLP